MFTIMGNNTSVFLFCNGYAIDTAVFTAAQQKWLETPVQKCYPYHMDIQHVHKASSREVVCPVSYQTL